MPFIELKTNINVNQNLKEEAFEFLNDHISILSGKNKEWLMINIIEANLENETLKQALLELARVERIIVVLRWPCLKNL